MRDKVDKLLKTIDELQSSESSNQLTARRAERELREEKERSLRMERELEGWKSLRGGSVDRGSGSAAALVGSLRGRMSVGGVGVGGSWRPSDGDEAVDVPARKSSIGRAPSLTKGFL